MAWSYYLSQCWQQQAPMAFIWGIIIKYWLVKQDWKIIFLKWNPALPEGSELITLIPWLLMPLVIAYTAINCHHIDDFRNEGPCFQWGQVIKCLHHFSVLKVIWNTNIYLLQNNSNHEKTGSCYSHSYMYLNLTHCGLVTPCCDRELDQHWLR